MPRTPTGSTRSSVASFAPTDARWLAIVAAFSSASATCTRPARLSVSAETKMQIEAATETGIPIVTTEQAHQALLDAGATPAEADAVTADYGNAQLDALKTSMLAVALLAVISFWFTRRFAGQAENRLILCQIKKTRHRPRSNALALRRSPTTYH